MTSRKHLWFSIILIVAFAFMGYWLSRPNTEGNRFSYGLDLVGGTELVYKADTSQVEDVEGAMESLKEVIERRIATANLSGALGALEPVIQTESAGIISGNREERLIVELPGVTDIDKAKETIGQTPQLEFRIENPQINADNFQNFTIEDLYQPTGITGQLLERARLEFEPTTRQPMVALEFNEEGRALLAKVTGENVGKQLAIFLDGELKQAPTIQSEITDGQAIITGYDAVTAKEVVRQLNFGALPVNIDLASSQTIGATLGEEALNSGARAGVIGFIALCAFMIFWYRLPGLISSVALVGYVILSLAIFKLIPVTLTAAGLAGFILSIGMAVDANVLIFERTKEELKKGKSIHDALHEGFHRAWLSIRDSNIASIITAIVLFWLGTSAVKGFALTLGIGVMISMFTAISVSRTFLFAVAPRSDTRLKKFLFSNGLK